MTYSGVAFAPSELRGFTLPDGRGCDFCATGVPAWRYPCRDVGLNRIVYGPTEFRPVSLGPWHACSKCADLVDVGDWPALARRTLRSLNLDLSHAGPGMRVRLLAVIHATHERFRVAKSGPREPI